MIPDLEETLTLAEESRLKMLLKHKDKMMQEKIKQIDTWNGYLRKERKTKPKRQNQTRNGKAGKDKVKVQA
ncbi:hypothetical protein Tco_1135738 [Tanacetum coccineum]